MKTLPPFPLLKRGLLAALLLAGATAAVAEPYRLLLASRADGAPAQDVFVTTYNSYGALVASPAAVGGDFSGIDIGAAYTAVTLTFDGKYRLVLSSRNDAAAGADVFIATYNTYGDFVASPAAVGGDFSGIDVGAAYQVRGLAYDGQYRLLLSSRADSGAGSDVFIATYNSYGDLVNSPAAVGGDFSGIDIGAGYIATGLAYDGKYRLMLSARNDLGAGSDVFIATYDTFADLVNSPAAVGGDFSGIDIGPGYQARGFTVEASAASQPGGGNVPEPGSWALAGLALLMCAAQRALQRPA